MQKQNTNMLCALLMIVGAGLVTTTGCDSGESNSERIQAELSINPSPPAVGNSALVLTMTNSDGTPVEGADVGVEANMNHAGMKPTFAALQEHEPGQYTGDLEFTMGGDWFVLVTAQTTDGTLVERKIDVKGVAPR